MPTGKPDFNLNSFGIKYLSKDEVQEFLNKYKIPTGDDQAALRTEREGKQGGKFQASLTAGKQIDATINTPKPEAEKPATPTGSTRSQFMSRETPSKLSHTERTLRQDMESSGTKVDTSGIVTQRQKPQPQTKPDEGKAPNRPTEHVGSIVDGGKVQGMDSKGKKRTISDASVKKEPKERTAAETTGKKGTKQLPKHVGDAPKGTKSEKELVGGRNVKVGVGSRAHKKLEKDPQGELTESQKPKEDKPDGRKVDLNTQHRSSKGVSAHNKRGKENSKWYSEEQRAAYKKIDPKDRTAQSKFHDEQEKKYGKSVSTPKKLSAAGQKLKDKLKKSNDIIMDMAIMKLNLMKDAQDGKGSNKPNPKAKPDMTNLGGDTRDFVNSKTEGYSEYHNQKPYDYVKYPDGAGNRVLGTHTRQIDPDDPEKRGKHIFDKEGIHGAESEYDRISHGGKKPNKQPIKKSAEETIFKAISLKLGLMKMDYNTESQYPHVKGTSGYKDPKKKLPTAPKDDVRRMSPSFDESHNISEDEEKTT